MNALKTTLIGAFMALSPLALKAQTSAQAFKANQTSITHVMNTAVVNDNTDPEKDNFKSGIVENCTNEAHEYSKDYRGVGIGLFAGKQGVEKAKAIGESLKGIYKRKYGVDSHYFIQITDHNTNNVTAIFYVNGVPGATAKNTDELKAYARIAEDKHTNRTQARPEGYGEKSMLSKEVKELLDTPTSELR